MLKHQNTILILSLIAILVALSGLQPGPAMAALPLGITETPTAPPPTDTPTDTPPAPTQPPPGPTETPLPPPPPTSEPTPTATDPGESEPPRPPQQRRPTATSTPFLPVTGELPPSTPFGGFGGYGLLISGILLGLMVGLLSRRGGKWISRFFSSTR